MQAIRAAKRPLLPMLAALLPGPLGACYTGATIISHGGPSDETTRSSDHAGHEPDSASATTGDASAPSTAASDTPTDDTTEERGDTTAPTGTTPPSCGNGVVEPPEECDDGPENYPTAACKPDCTRNKCGDGEVQHDELCDDGDANVRGIPGYGECSDACQPGPSCKDAVLRGEIDACDPHEPGAPKIPCDQFCNLTGALIFISSAQLTGAMGGLAKADKLCNDLAAAAAYPLPGKYQAWLMSADSSFEERFPQLELVPDIPYYQLNDPEPLGTYADLKVAGPARPIWRTEAGTELGETRVWTNINREGDPGPADCDAWTANFAAPVKVFGYNKYADPKLQTQWKYEEHWTHASGAPIECFQQQPIYCLQVPTSK